MNFDIKADANCQRELEEINLLLYHRRTVSLFSQLIEEKYMCTLLHSLYFGIDIVETITIQENVQN